LAQAKRPLKDAAAVNATRWALFNALKEAGVPVTTGSGGLTKFNRVQLGIPKTHALDAVCVGAVSGVTGWGKPTLGIKCTGRGSYQRTRLDAFSFPRGYLTREKRIKGFQTGDMVSADVTKGKKIGFYPELCINFQLCDFQKYSAIFLIFRRSSPNPRWRDKA